MSSGRDLTPYEIEALRISRLPWEHPESDEFARLSKASDRPLHQVFKALRTARLVTPDWDITPAGRDVLDELGVTW